jgi:hypothetical protein
MDVRVVWDDLVLPEPEIATLRAIAAELRQRMTVGQRGGFAGKGISCAYHLSHPDIFVMESAEEWDCYE